MPGTHFDSEQRLSLILETQQAIAAAEVHDARRPIANSIARYAIESGQPLLVEDTRTDHGINQELRSKVGDTSLICVPLFSGSDVIGTLNVMSNS